ncbi:hypothetical protein A0J61_07949 [Choanephora cucurbitarum]|uniref:Survival Motor Neuron Gemin2-binding domain-containing protein n=1 Tax=Choanephora cucurbitarum TaxID=101091 RepID=A0A1C7N4R5_9FUNG|nr:hypothetical protein A0J61_07949 [Choanephora cucurbitarum]
MDELAIGTVLYTQGDAKHEDIWDDTELIEHWDRSIEAYRQMQSTQGNKPIQQKHKVVKKTPKRKPPTHKPKPEHSATALDQGKFHRGYETEEND